uniref:Uncharacterized protein n=1 Tax=Arundo donax TaxID=35708 RepID=A0A0A8Y8J8_ARUDO
MKKDQISLLIWPVSPHM